MSSLEMRQRYPRFVKGEIVKMTEEAVRANLKRRGSLYGEVMADPEPTRVGRMSVTVKRVDQSTRSKYWAGFWRHLKPSEVANAD